MNLRATPLAMPPLHCERMKEIKKVQRQAIQCKFEPIGPTLFKIVVGARRGLLPTLWWVGSWLPTYLLDVFFLSSKEKISQRESNRQPRYSKLGASPLSFGSLGSSRT